MRDHLNTVARRVAKASGRIASQIVVSVAGTLFVGLITTNYFTPKHPEPNVLVAIPAPEAGILPGQVAGNFWDPAFRIPPSYPHEFEALLGPIANGSFTTLSSATWASPQPEAAGGPPQATVQPRSLRKPQLAAKPACAEGCGRERPNNEPSMPQAATAPSLPPPEAERLTVLGIALPQFVPTPGTIVRTVGSWGSAIGSFVGGG
jgi:hypothetical protein